MFLKVSLLLVVGNYVASAIHVRVNDHGLPLDKAGDSNGFCNRAKAQRTQPFTCSDGFACLDVATVIRGTCTKCLSAGLMTEKMKTQCHKNTETNDNIVKGIKTYCNTNNKDYHRMKNAYTRTGCAFLTVSRGGHPNWSAWGPEQICPCVTKFVDDCKQPKDSKKSWKYGLACMLKKIEQCPKVCPEMKSRIKDAAGNSLMEGKVENDLKKRASVLVDAQGKTSRKTSRNASASILSLDMTAASKCAEQ